MKDKRVMLVAGQSGSKSTFAGALRHHVKNQDELGISARLTGHREDYNERVIKRMESQGKYPGQTLKGYKVKYTIKGKSFARSSTELSIIDIPGENQDVGFQPPGEPPLMLQLRQGTVADRDDITDEYNREIRDDFQRGNPPNQNDIDKWQTMILHHLYQADSVIFLLNLHKVIVQNEDLAYRWKEIKWATNNFTDVAVVPTATDLVGYDPDNYEPGLVERVVKGILGREGDDELGDVIGRQINSGISATCADIVSNATIESEVDFFGVSVPAKERQSENLTPDNRGGFAVKGFDKVIKWLEN